MYSVDQVSEFSIFADFSAEQIARVLSCAVEQHCQKGCVIIEESSNCTDFYIIVKGRVDVELQTYGRQALGGSKRLALLRNGDIVGDLAYVEQRRRAAQATAVDDVQILSIPKATLDTVFEQDPKLGFLFMRNIARIISQRLIDLNFMWRDDV